MLSELMISLFYSFTIALDLGTAKVIAMSTTLVRPTEELTQD